MNEYVWPGRLSWIPALIALAPMAPTVLLLVWFQAVARYHRGVNTWDEARSLSRRDSLALYLLRYLVTMVVVGCVVLPIRWLTIP